MVLGFLFKKGRNVAANMMWIKKTLLWQRVLDSKDLLPLQQDVKSFLNWQHCSLGNIFMFLNALTIGMNLWKWANIAQALSKIKLLCLQALYLGDLISPPCLCECAYPLWLVIKVLDLDEGQFSFRFLEITMLVEVIWGYWVTLSILLWELNAPMGDLNTILNFLVKKVVVAWIPHEARMVKILLIHAWFLCKPFRRYVFLKFVCDL